MKHCAPVFALAVFALAAFALGPASDVRADDEAGAAMTAPYAKTNDPVSGYYNNTAVCRGANNWCHYWWNPDHTFIAFGIHWGPRGDKGDKPSFWMGEGKWFLAAEGRKYGNICRIPAPDEEILLTNCTLGQSNDFLNRHVGDVWAMPERDGSAELNWLLHGHQ